MGLLQDGKWVDQRYDTKATGGRLLSGKYAGRDIELLERLAP